MGFGHYALGWHPTATIGVFAATATAARLSGLDRTQLSVAWGIAASQAAGVVLNFGTMTKPVSCGARRTLCGDRGDTGSNGTDGQRCDLRWREKLCFDLWW